MQILNRNKRVNKGIPTDDYNITQEDHLTVFRDDVTLANVSQVKLFFCRKPFDEIRPFSYS